MSAWFRLFPSSASCGGRKLMSCLGLYTPTSGIEELETVTALYVFLLLKPHDSSDTVWESSQHGLIALHIIWQVAAIL